MRLESLIMAIDMFCSKFLSSCRPSPTVDCDVKDLKSPSMWLSIAKILYSLFPVPSYRLASARLERFARTPQTSCPSSGPTSVSVLWSSHNSASIRTWRICHSARNSLDQKGIVIHTAGESSQEQRQVIFSEVAKFKETLKLTRPKIRNHLGILSNCTKIFPLFPGW